MKILFYLFVIFLTIVLLNFWYQTYLVGQYYRSAGLLFAMLGGLAPFAIIFGTYKLIVYIKNN